jgi:8-oxo-dGTP diphosphatase
MTFIAGVLIKQNGKYLLVQEKQSHVYAQWNLPAGHVDKGETLLEAAKREGKEETGLDLEIGNELLKFTTGTDREVHIFESKIIGGEIKWNPEELLNVRWFSKEEIRSLKLRSENYRKLFK